MTIYVCLDDRFSSRINKYLGISEKSDTFAALNSVSVLRQRNQYVSLPDSAPARMAESVDALVSNTSGAIRAGSIPAPGTKQNASA